MKNIARYDQGQISEKMNYTPEGYLKGNAIVTRTGIFQYQNQDGSVRNELRHPEDIWVLDSIKTMEMIPITNNHPLERLVTPENSKKLSIGYTGESVKKDGQNISTNIMITDKEGIEAVKNGRRQLSLGYLVDLVDESGIYEGQRYDARQTNIRYNHLAIVDKARAGDVATMNLDNNDAVEILKIGDKMTKRKIKIDDDEIFVEEREADYIDKLLLDMRNLEDEKSRVERELEIIREKLEKAEVERDDLKDKSLVSEESQKMDSEKFQQAVIERTNILKVALDCVSSDVMKKIHSLSDMDIKKEVIKACKKSVDITIKSASYVDCMYDLILSEKAEKKVNIDGIQKFDVTMTSNDPLTQARNEMIAKSKTFINTKN